MSLFPTIFTLRDTKININSSYDSDESSNIKAPINKVLSFRATLSVPYVNSDDSHVQFGRYFNNSWFRCKSDIVEDVILLDDCFNISGIEMIL